jgi:hypothetical protein
MIEQHQAPDEKIMSEFSPEHIVLIDVLAREIGVDRFDPARA